MADSEDFRIVTTRDIGAYFKPTVAHGYIARGLNQFLPDQSDGEPHLTL